jgi:hypothetical protein
MNRPALKESDIEAVVEQNFRNHGWMTIDTHGPKHRPIHTGISDYIMVKYGFVAWVEAKRPLWKPAGPDAKLSKTERDQRKFREEIVDAGCPYVIIQTIEECVADLARLDVLAEELRAWKEQRKKKRAA